ncbi:hypothetical protein A0123_02047 [Gluconobacter cerinus]|uniref:Uncharacterized protein n=1 Tax=Gluconobacter cerinus TaxID=38307 RepID=A0A1B6VK71_9PROT|nr:hypothetical protein A0123_02047 [Gluconobacter cerinus]
MIAAASAETSYIAAPLAIASQFVIVQKSHFALKCVTKGHAGNSHENHVGAGSEERIRADDRYRARGSRAGPKARARRRGGSCG